MRSNYKKLNSYIRLVDERNSDGSLGEDNLYGISVTKDFIVTHANLVGVTFDNYKVVAPRQFAYIPDTSRRGDKIAISLNTTGEKIIVSSICTVFEIADEDQLLPEYLMLWFMRPEFDRYARFMSNGSAREVFDWDCMCGVEFPVPTISEQRKIVHDYQVITDRIELLRKMNENLEAQSLALYKAYFVDFEMSGGEMPPDWKRTTVGDVASVTRGASPRPIQVFMCEVGMPWVKIADASASFSKYLFGTAECIIEDGVIKSRLVKPKTMVVSNSASPGLPMLMEIEACVHDGWLIIDHYKGVSQEFMYYFFINERQKIVLQSNGSVFNNLKTDIVKEQQIVIPDERTMASVTEKFKSINSVILNNAKEAELLKNLRKYLLGTIMCTEAKGA